MKKVLMISDNDIVSSQSLGVTKKLLSQYKAFSDLGCDTYHLCLKNNDGVLIHKNETTVLVKRKKKAFFTYIKLLSTAKKVCEENKIDICYIRYPLADFSFMKMIKALHNICKVVVEIPTYPYDGEKYDTGIITKINRFQDKINRKKLKKYVNYISTFSQDEEIFGVKTICIENGTNVFDTEYIGGDLDFSNDIRLVAVARVSKYNGYDRLVSGLKNYYSSPVEKKVYFEIVGDGPELDYLKQKVDESSLSEYVIFNGKRTGKELDDIYRRCQIGVASLACHRIGLTEVSGLKPREYCAKGMPFIIGVKDRTFENTPFCKSFSADDDPIDINEIIKYYDFVKSHAEIHFEMRSFAEENLTWEKQLKKVLDAIENE